MTYEIPFVYEAVLLKCLKSILVPVFSLLMARQTAERLFGVVIGCLVVRLIVS